MENKSSSNVNIDSPNKELLLQEAAKKIACLNKSCVTDAPLQDGNVSSSNPPVLATELFGPALEELKAFLFVVNSQGKIVSVTDNITQYLGYPPSDWSDRSIYNFLHAANHVSFGQNLLSIDSDRKEQHAKFGKPYPFLCRMKQCASDGGEKRDVHMMISSLPYQLEDTPPQCNSGPKMYLICVAQKVENPIALYSSSTHRAKRTNPQAFVSPDFHKSFPPKTVEFTTHANADWVVISCDMSAVPFQCDTLVGKKFTDFVCSNDVARFQTHMDAVKSSDSAEHSSSIYRFKLSSTRYAFIHTNSHLTAVTKNSKDSNRVIFSKHSILRECDSSELKGSASTSFMKALSSPPQAQSALGTGLLQPLEFASQVANGFMPNSPPYQSKSVRLTGSVGSNPPPYHQHHHQLQPQQTNVNTSAASTNLNMTLMSGMSQLPDMNFNDCYPSPRINFGGSNAGSFDSGDSGMSWLGTVPGAAGKVRGHHMAPPNSQGHGIRLSIHNQNAGVALDSTISTHTSSTDTYTSHSYGPLDNVSLSHSLSSADTTLNGLLMSPADEKVELPPDTVLRKLLQAKDDEEYQSYCTASIISQQSSSVSSSAGVSRGSDITQVSPASATSASKPSEHQLLKKLLNDVRPSEEHKFTERASGVLEKLFKDEEKEVTPIKKSPSSHSPTTSNTSRSRRHSSGGSNADNALSNRSDESGRGTKRKIVSSAVSTSVSSTSSLSTAEADSTAAALGNTHLLSHLLTKAADTSAKAEPQDITATPLEKLQAQIDSQRGSSGRTIQQPNNIVDVVNDKIMLGAEQIDLNRFTSLPARTSNSATSGSAGGLYPARHPPNYMNGNMYDSRLHMPNSMENSNSIMRSQGNTTMMGNYHGLENKDYYGMLGSEHPHPPQQQPPQQQPQPHTHMGMRSEPPLSFQQALKMDHNSMMSLSNRPGGSLSTPNSIPTTTSMLCSTNASNVLDHSLSINHDPDGIIQELESLLGDNSSTVNLTSPEDELAIKDIEKDLLSSIGSLSNGGDVGYTPVIAPNTGNNRPETHSPIPNMDIPASASNPVQSANINISHRPPHPPPISSSHMTSFNSQDSNNPHLHQALRGQLPPGQGALRGMAMSSMRSGHRAIGRQASGSGRSMPLSLDSKMRHHSGNSPGSMMAPFSPIGHNLQGNFTLPSNFNEIMKSTDAPPNKKVPQDVNSNSFAHRPSPAEMMHISSPRNNRVPPQNFPPSPMDVACSPQHFRFPDQYQQSRPMVQRQPMMRPMAPQQQYNEHMAMHQQSLMGGASMNSPQGMRGPPVGSTPMDTLPTLPPASNQSSVQQQYNQAEQWILNQRVSNNSVGSSQYVKQEVRAKINAKNLQHNTSPQHQQQNFVSQQQQLHQQQSIGSHPSQHMGMMSPRLAPPTSTQPHLQSHNSDPFSAAFTTSTGSADPMSRDPLADFEESVLPDDILNQITELTDTQNEIQQQKMANSNNFGGESMGLTAEQDIAIQKINQSQKETSHVRAQLRALAGPPSQPDGTLVNVFRRQLATNPPATSKSKNNAKSSEPLDVEKLKHLAQNPNSVNIISLNPHPPVEELGPTDQTGSLLQKLLTEGSY